MDHLRGSRDHPTGKLKIHAPPMVVEMAIVPIWRKFLDRYPSVELEVSGSEETTDIVAKGYDAGIAPREFVALDMTAVRVTPPIEIAVVGSPSYFARHPIPKTPEDLLKHNCIQTRLMKTGTLVSWTLTRKRSTRAVVEKSNHIHVAGNLIVADLDLGLRAAVDGLGLNYTLASHSEFLVQSGHLVRVLEDWSPVFEGLCLYYPGNRHIPVALRALIDMLRTTPNKPPTLNAENPFLGHTAVTTRQGVVAKRMNKPAAPKASIKKAK
jgi:DNA-binding transcriptional LysR family regulator